MTTTNRFATAAKTMHENQSRRNTKQRADKVIRSILRTQPDMEVCLPALRSVIVPLDQMMQELQRATKGKLTTAPCTEIKENESWFEHPFGCDNILPHANWPVAGKLCIPMICYTLQLKDIVLHVNALSLLKSFGIWHVDDWVVFGDSIEISQFLTFIDENGESHWPRVPMYYYWIENKEGEEVYFPEDRAEAQGMGMYIPPYKRSSELQEMEEYIQEALSRSLELIPLR